MARRKRDPEKREREMIANVVQRMREAREERTISREEIAYRLGVDFSTVGRWERGTGKDGPPLWAVWGYAQFTGTPITHLLGEDSPDLEAFQAANLEGLRKSAADIQRGLDDLERQLAVTLHGEAQGL